MMEWMRGWIMSVCCAAMVLVIAELLIPDERFRRVGRLAGGMVLLISVMAPFMGFKNGEFALPADVLSISTEQHHSALTEQKNLIYKSIIEQYAAAYIQDKAEEIGAVCSVRVTAVYDESNLPIPYEACLTGEMSETQIQQLGEILESEIGISPERQSFEGSGTR